MRRRLDGQKAFVKRGVLALYRTVDMARRQLSLLWRI
jgi:hypothetical protein